MQTELWQAARVVHRYCGRQHGGHCEVASTGPLAKAIEPLVHRRSDLAGEDLGRPVPPYFSGYPLPDGRYAFARTRYLEDADCLGAVRTESLLLSPEQQAELAHPLLLVDAFDEPADLGAELKAVHKASGPHDVAPRDLSAAVPGSSSPDLSGLLALPDEKLEPLLHAYCGSLPVAVVGGTPALLGELLQLAPNPWALGLCTQALSHRDWARLQAVPPEAAERFVLRAARDKDVAVVDLVGRALQGVVSSPVASWIHARLRAGELEPLLGLVERASTVSAYTVPADLAAQLRFEELSGKTLSSDEVIEHVNHLKVRGAAPEALAAAFTPLLAAAAEGRAGFTLNVLRSGWLPTNPDPSAGAAVGELLEQAAREGSGRALNAFLEAAGDRFPEARARGLRAVAARLGEHEPWAEREDEAWRDLALEALLLEPDLVSAALVERAPWLSESEFGRALRRVQSLGKVSDATWLHMVDTAAGTESAGFAAAVRAAGREPSLRDELGLRVAARAPQDPSLIGELSAEWDFDQLATLLRGLDPAAWSTAAEVLRERVESLALWDAGGGRALARLAALGRGDPGRQDLARDHGLRLFRASRARERMLELARLKGAAGAREVLLKVLNALRGKEAPPASEHEAWRALLQDLALPLDDTLAVLLPRAAWSVELATLAPRVPAPPLSDGPLAERMLEVADQAAAALVASPAPCDPACAPWLAVALERSTDPADNWGRAVAVLARDLEPGPTLERLRAAALTRRDTFGPDAQLALRALVEALPASELAQQLLDLELTALALPVAERGDTPALTNDAWRTLLGLASQAKGPATLWTRVGAAVGAGQLDLSELRALTALPLARALDGLGGGFSLRIQNGLQRLALTLAAGDDPDRLAVTIRAVIGASQGDRELRQRLASQIQAALEQAASLRTPSVFEALRALLK